MGEYASYNGQSIKIGTCENMYYLRADQAHLVTAEPNSLDVIQAAEHIRFRFPFPKEDHIKPGDFDNPDEGLNVYADVPEGVEHYTVQFVKGNGGGYLASLPCPLSPEAKDFPVKIHRNGGRAGVNLVQQKVCDGMLVAVAECAACGARYRMPTLEDAAELLAALDAEVASNRNEYNRYASPTRADYIEKVAARVREGYTNPPAWVAARKPAEAVNA